MIDTAEKRKSACGVTSGWGVTPNAAKDLEWRQQVGWSYSGIATGAPPVVTGRLFGVLGIFTTIFGAAFTLPDEEDD